MMWKLFCLTILQNFHEQGTRFSFLRRKPIQGYDLSFVIINWHMEPLFEMEENRVTKYIATSVNDGYELYLHCPSFNFVV